MQYAHMAAWLLAILFIVAGLVGNLLPLLPAAPLLLAGFWLGAWLDDFQRVGWGWLSVLTALGIVMVVVDFIAGAVGGKQMQASRQAVIGATLGSVVGIFFGLPGLVFGPFVGAVGGEWMARGNALQAGKIGLATWLGLLAGMVFKLALSLMMIAMFVFAWWY